MPVRATPRAGTGSPTTSATATASWPPAGTTTSSTRRLLAGYTRTPIKVMLTDDPAPAVDAAAGIVAVPRTWRPNSLDGVGAVLQPSSDELRETRCWTTPSESSCIWPGVSLACRGNGAELVSVGHDSGVRMSKQMTGESPSENRFWCGYDSLDRQKAKSSAAGGGRVA